MKAKSWLDKLPADVRHALILVGSALITWAGATAASLPQPLPEISGVILSLVALRYTSLTKQYGTGSTK